MTPSNSDDGVRHIGAVAELTGLSIRTLRHYDEVGLVTPSGRSGGGFRLYTADDVERLLLIRRMKPLGFSLDEMAALLETSDDHRRQPTAETSAKLADYIRVASERRNELVVQVGRADELIARLVNLTKAARA